jgi:long-chain acyl-CoA synthetase
MPELRKWAEATPDKPACIIAETGSILSYRELDRRANRVAQLLQARGLQPGDGIALMLPNEPRFFEIVWAARRLGLYYTPISKHLQPDEAIHIIRDCAAKTVFMAGASTEIADRLIAGSNAPEVFILDPASSDARDYDMALLAFDRYAEFPDVPAGTAFLYSSGTTGRPKGIRYLPIVDQAVAGQAVGWMNAFGFDNNTVYLSPAPLYHAAPVHFTMRMMVVGATVVVMSRFDAESALAAMETYKVTHSQWVPTMFFRLLSLPEAVRFRFDLSSHRCAIHAAAPCPNEIKERMIAWWGPILWEYYGASERYGATLISGEEWLARKGSVGKAVIGVPHILDADGRELGPGEIGDIYFDGPGFEYHNDPEKTARSRGGQGWSTLGDVGYLDEQGYLYLTDRRAHMIISGGVNIYPAEIENVLALHPAVRDVGVFGVPNAEFGEEVKAAVELFEHSRAGVALEGELIAWCRERLSHIKCPRSIDFHAALPRQETGKLFKHVLRKAYLTDASAP